MKNSARSLLLALVATVCLCAPTWAQEKEAPKDWKKKPVSPLIRSEPSREPDSPEQQTVQRRTLDGIEDAISKGDAALLRRHLGSQVYISLKGSEGGYYSANQALFVLENFFSLHRPVSFTFSTHGETEETPFATGRGHFTARGVRESVQIYVSLTQYEGRWVVAEFNVY